MTSLQCPAKATDSLGVVQPLLVFQMQTVVDTNVALEVVVLDQRAQRRRLHFSSTFRAAESNELHAQIPWAWGGVLPDQWSHVVLDLKALTANCFRGATFSSLDSFSLRPVCRVRKVFSLPEGALRVGADDTSLSLRLEGGGEGLVEAGGGEGLGQGVVLVVPPALAFPPGTNAEGIGREAPVPVALFQKGAGAGGAGYGNKPPPPHQQQQADRR